MAEKDKVPVVVIRQIVKMRSDEHNNYSYRVIAEHIKNEFGIEVTLQAVRYLYRKNKDNFSNQVVISTDENIEPSEPKNDIKVEAKKPAFKPKKPTSLETVFTRDESIDLKDLFDEAEQS